MTLAPNLGSVEALFAKMERERYRAFHSQDMSHKADHFQNFCTTAHSMQDYLLERLGKISREDQAPFRKAWKADPYLLAAADVANTAKHFQLRYPGSREPRSAKTKRVTRSRTSLAEVRQHTDGRIVVLRRTNVPTYSVVLEDGARFELYEYMDCLITYWKHELRRHGIRVRSQSLGRLIGGVTYSAPNRPNRTS